MTTTERISYGNTLKMSVEDIPEHHNSPEFTKLHIEPLYSNIRPITDFVYNIGINPGTSLISSCSTLESHVDYSHESDIYSIYTIFEESIFRPLFGVSIEEILEKRVSVLFNFTLLLPFSNSENRKFEFKIEM
jgi:hypothetical protein